MQNNLQFFTQLAQGFKELKRVPDIQYEYNPRELVFSENKVKLYHYAAQRESRASRPLLVVFATVNRPEVLDLFPESSFIKCLLNKGKDVYLLDWGYPSSEDHHLTLNDYLKLLHACVTFMKKKNRGKKIDLVGICQGGVLSLCYATLYQHIKNLVLISTPIDFHTKDNVLSKMVSKIQLADSYLGNVAGELLTQCFISLRPFELMGKKYLRFIDHLSDVDKTERFLRVEKWLHDAPDQAGKAFYEFVTDFYQQNKLIKAEIAFAGRKVDLQKLTVPILNIMGTQDHIVPTSASKPLKKYVGSKDYKQKSFPSGHIGLYLSEKIGNRLANAIAIWLGAR